MENIITHPPTSPLEKTIIYPPTSPTAEIMDPEENSKKFYEINIEVSTKDQY
jgi:hypothetical protein